MRPKKERPISSNNKEISLKETIKTDIEIAKKEGKKVRAVVNCDFTEYEPVEEQEEAAPKH
jgi:hypothetical protein